MAQAVQPHMKPVIGFSHALRFGGNIHPRNYHFGSNVGRGRDLPPGRARAALFLGGGRAGRRKRDNINGSVISSAWCHGYGGSDFLTFSTASFWKRTAGLYLDRGAALFASN